MNKQEIEYEDAPSGFVTFYNYKVPLMKFDKGFGYVGALLFDGKTEQIQCHFCGQWFNSLAHHIHREHNMTAAIYKEKVGLFKTTALLSESMRMKLIAKGMDKRLKNLRPGTKHSEETKKKIAETLKRNGETAEGMNLRGTCPAQLLDRLRKLYQKKGDKMKRRDDEVLYDLLMKTYGSNKEAFRLAGIPYRKPGQTIKWKNHIKKEKIKLKPPTYNIYTREKLVESLKRFKKMNGRNGAHSDCARGLLPSYQRYRYVFGSFPKAIKESVKD